GPGVSNTFHGVEDDEPAEARAVDLVRVAAGREEPRERGPTATLRAVARVEPDLRRRLHAEFEPYEVRPVQLPAADQESARIARMHEPEHLLDAPRPRAGVALRPADAQRRSCVEADRVGRSGPIPRTDAERGEVDVRREAADRTRIAGGQPWDVPRAIQ